MNKLEIASSFDVYLEVTHTVFYHYDFYPAFLTDIKTAKSLALIQSPFLRMRQINKLKAALRACIQRGIRICVLVRQPEEWENPSDYNLIQLEEGTRALREIGVHVSFRRNIHEKLAVIDETIFWEGSLNILSHNDSSERITRWVGHSKVLEAVHSHKLDTCDVCCARGGSCTPVDETQQRKLIGAAIADRRRQLGLSQRNLARRAGLERARISNIELGDLNVSLSTLYRVCTELRLGLRIVPSYFIPAIDDLIVKRCPDDRD